MNGHSNIRLVTDARLVAGLVDFFAQFEAAPLAWERERVRHKEAFGALTRGRRITQDNSGPSSASIHAARESYSNTK